MAANRPQITGITVHVKMPNGTSQSHEIDPNDCDAMAWSDRAVEVLGKFYDKDGPAEGKHMSREDFLHHFPHGAPIIGDRPHLPMLPETVLTIWNHPKADGNTTDFVCKAVSNIINGK